MNKSLLINQTSNKVEYYTPPFIIEGARKILGEIDLDPASCDEANSVIKAKEFFTKEVDGLTKKWYGRVWMNHPFGKGQNNLWINKLISEWKSGNIEAACCITYASTSERWFYPLLHYPQCFLFPRTQYYLPGWLPMNQVTKGSVITYLGPNLDKFAYVFSSFGVTKVYVQGSNK